MNLIYHAKWLTVGATTCAVVTLLGSFIIAVLGGQPSL